MDDTQKAEHAKRLLEDGLFNEAINVVKGYHTATFCRIDATEQEVMEARRMVLALEAVTKQLEVYILTGEIKKRTAP